MIFLLCLDPLMSRHRKAYMEQQNEELNLVSLKIFMLHMPGILFVVLYYAVYYFSRLL